MTPSLRLSGKVAVITGAGSGIGKASAMRMLAEGASVVFADVNEFTGTAALQEAVQSGHAARARFVKADVSQEADVASIVAVARSEFGRLDCMFNNAGVPGALGPLDEMRADEWDFTFAVLA
ncbi:MAG TPA: SDR family NAD(P)-dependent oxidoreductase, partial [Candidatus Eisenbacteria bacterium]|nr:SDR family NAD(P)-dependent oxidoreductase [Candidatus Eisenbacteria bacterium]